MTITGKVPRRLAALLSAVLLFGALAKAAEDASPLADPLAGQLLVATTKMRDPRFRHAVVLLLRHNEKGAFGIVINRPLGERPIASLLAEADGKRGHGDGKKDGKPGDSAAIEGTIRVFLGGPVQPRYGFVVHSTDYRRPETLAVSDTVAMTASKDVLRDIGKKRGPARYLFALGYSGWSAGQLEGEIARRDWFTAPADPDLIFEADTGTIWEKAMARRLREL